jgi:hypothetical protein
MSGHGTIRRARADRSHDAAGGLYSSPYRSRVTGMPQALQRPLGRPQRLQLKKLIRKIGKYH